MNINKISKATSSAFIKKRKLIHPMFLNMLSSDLLKYHYSINNNLLFDKYRILAVDGTVNNNKLLFTLEY